MKKLSLLMLLSVFVFWGCSNDDDEVKNEVRISFENQLTETESEFESTSTEVSGYFFKDTFNDPQNLVTFDHYYTTTYGYSFAGFTYTNMTNHPYKGQPNCGTAKSGKVYMGVYSDKFTTALMTINNPQYSIKGAWITNSKNAYVGMTEGDGWARVFKTGDWYKVTATGYDDNGNKVGETSILLADYKSDTDKPINEWIWFDLTSLRNATKISFIPDSSDFNEQGMKTGAYFCLDNITLIEK